MEYEFEARTEEEAIELAARELGLSREQFDVEILESQKGGFLKKGKTRIKIYTTEAKIWAAEEAPAARNRVSAKDGEAKILEFVTGLVERMGYNCKATVLFREEQKLGIRLDSSSAAILIGKKGKNLDSLQLLVNVYAGQLGYGNLRVILDTENYRIRREESIVKMAYETAEQVRRNRVSVLLEAMNPFERRIVHTTLNDIVDIETKSEGEGLYKQVRVTFRGKI
ncbi:MAG: single-stranded DNA-binding protein [Spirochaetes bacterium GWD1_61_31]|nr:MAG: single-stranded DNA-binding protein [Spirochaetes bacterium GWB1_60_80]OHD35390.1 MAG: single-stranded DNA-binding protein [Spirochaetes bacterium GWC1_61_12]OHD36540.1 MAG: single-stranded DNA-binding protein [Spirochaetes bacterium GWD1_61_31]OHD42254.1 MAG: single-stranded DNA-binding protein [Spirochaetes bacterium GWE1_60_18]OHD58183.1 MAG: single-stranded DNA-binding protein [Spirochaetes bacterium GWF1_60_12]HBO40887.1 protein jag [Spirochaetaceae bacterium]